MYAIKTEHLTKYYGKARGIADVSLTVEEGDFYGFIGPNGAGKSTTIRTLLGLITATGGTAELFGMDVQKEKRTVLANIGYLPSEAMFYSGMRVKDILKLCAFFLAYFLMHLEVAAFTFGIIKERISSERFLAHN